MDPNMQRYQNTQNHPIDYQQFLYHYGNANSRVEIVYVEDFPSGYRFQPSDDELIMYYLKKKVKNEPIPYSKIHEVDLYKYNPQELSETFSHPGENKWYFFTQRDRKYLNGSRPNRATGSGYWKATGADKDIHHNGEIVGSKKSLVFYEGRPPKGKKTNWLMQEYKVQEPNPKRNCNGSMKLDDWVLCRIYNRDGQNTKDIDQQTYEDHQETSRSVFSNEENLATMACNNIGMAQSNEGLMNRLGIDLTSTFPQCPFPNNFTEAYHQAMNPCFPNSLQNNNFVLPNSQSGWEYYMQRVYPLESGFEKKKLLEDWDLWQKLFPHMQYTIESSSEKKNLLEDWDFWQKKFHATGVYVDEKNVERTEPIAAQFEPPSNEDSFIDFSDPLLYDIVLDTDQLQQDD